jgi:hypothetical protein
VVTMPISVPTIDRSGCPRCSDPRAHDRPKRAVKRSGRASTSCSRGLPAKTSIGVAVWSTDRLGPSMLQLMTFLEALKAKGLDLYDHARGIDTSTDMGKAFFYMSGIFAEIERNMIERIRAGLKRAKAEGTKLGRPPDQHRSRRQDPRATRLS